MSPVCGKSGSPSIRLHMFSVNTDLPGPHYCPSCNQTLGNALRGHLGIPAIPSMSQHAGIPQTRTDAELQPRGDPAAPKHGPRRPEGLFASWAAAMLPADVPRRSETCLRRTACGARASSTSPAKTPLRPAWVVHPVCALGDRSGYESASKDFDDLEVQVPGRIFLVTRGNSSIGKVTTLEMAKRGGIIHLVCCNQKQAEGARGELIRESGNQNIFLQIVDLSDPKKIWKFVDNFKQEHKLNVLINNVGCMVNKRELTEDGLEKNFATNTLGVYIHMTGLIPVLEKEHDPRVITVSSGGMLVQKLDTDDLQSERTAFDGTMVYAQNKV
ncbi:dehydrogenase/reductase SDR family member 12 [Carlito syrichta]|uniref:Dehydrogenase/reductase SDR family member 12 n=1 Tax=Carlito syrichta TaxID=1868482 RepID=A0A3Q0EDW4_CARSF|nr:dehydrogenase/reductase SDR family member 12 [Carlito syrichta]